MHRGFLTRINIEKSQVMSISFSQFYYLSNADDLRTLISEGKAETSDTGNGYVKLLNGDIHVAHSSHGMYQSMLRIFKTYHFPTRNPDVGSQWISFSSRPGDLSSRDDFYTTSSGLSVFKTALMNFKL